MFTHKLHPGGDALTRRHAKTAVRRLLVASSLCVAVAAGTAATAEATTSQRGHASVVVHVLPTTFHQSYGKELNGVSSAQANAPKGYSFARGVHPASSAPKIGESCAESNCPMPYNGGSVQHTPHVYLLFWGPNWVTNPLIPRVKIQSKPGSALGTKRIRPAKLAGGSPTEATGAVTLFRVMKLGWLGGR